MRALVILTFVLPTQAVAQTTTVTPESDGTYALEERFVAQPDLNRAACAPEATEPITIDLEHALAPVTYLDDVILRAWVVPSADSACTGQVPQITDAAYLGDLTLSPSDPFFAGSDVIRVPDDLEDETATTPTLTSTSLLTDQSACTEAGVERTVTLCFALDENKDGAIEVGDTVRAYEPRAWVRLKLDTIAPGKPASLRVTPRDGGLRLSATRAAEDEATDVTAWRAYLRERPTDETEAARGCADWLPAQTRSTTATADGDGNASFTVSAQNGITYQVCVAALDDSDNEGPPSEVADGTPQVECDFIECYPDDLLAGGCAAAPSAAPLLAAVVLLVRRRRPRREEQPS